MGTMAWKRRSGGGRQKSDIDKRLVSEEVLGGTFCRKNITVQRVEGGSVRGTVNTGA